MADIMHLRGRGAARGRKTACGIDARAVRATFQAELVTCSLCRARLEALLVSGRFRRLQP